MHQAANPTDPIELNRRLENIVRTGVVEEVRYGRPSRCRVRSGKLLSAWVPWIAQAAGGNQRGRHWRAPAIGEQCMLLSPGGDMTQAVALPGIISDAMPQGSESESAERTDWSETEYMEHDRATGKLTIVCATAIELRVGSGRLVIDESGVHGWPDMTGDGRISLVNHKHGGVESGASSTGEPQ